MIKMNLAVGVLTYGDRSHLLYPVIDRLVEQDLNIICVYCNGIKRSLFDEIRGRYRNENVDLIYSDENLGSAGGYYKLLEHMSKSDDSQFLMLLDDDNLVPDNFFEKLKNVSVEDDEILFLNRKDRHILLEAKEQKKPWLELGSKNSFLGRDFFEKLVSSHEEVEGDIIAAPYSGLILHRSIIEGGVFPNKTYYLYADDYEYTYRLVMEYGFKIKIIDNIQIEDLEVSFHLDKKGATFLSNRYSNAEKIRLYYSVRNQFYFGLNRSEMKSIFFANFLIVSAYITFGFLLRLDFKRIAWYYSAIMDGYKWKFSAK